MNRRLYLIFQGIELVLMGLSVVSLAVFTYFKFLNPLIVHFPDWFVVFSVSLFFISFIFHLIGNIFFEKYMKEKRK